MNNKNNFLIIAIVLLVLVISATLYQLNKTRAVQQNSVLTANAILLRGSRISQHQLSWVVYAPEKIKAKYFVQSDIALSDIVNGVVLREIRPGEPITQEDIIPAGVDVNYQAILQKNMRAITVAMGDSNLGMTRAGDYVDIILTYTLSAGENKNSDNLVSKTLLRKVLVLGIYGLTADNGVFSGASQDKNRAILVTFEVTPKQVETLTLAEKMGSISLSINNEYLQARARKQSYTTSNSLGSIGQTNNTVTVIRGSTVENLNIVNGQSPERTVIPQMNSKQSNTEAEIRSENNNGARKGP